MEEDLKKEENRPLRRLSHLRGFRGSDSHCDHQTANDGLIMFSIIYKRAQRFDRQQFSLQNSLFLKKRLVWLA